MLKDAVIARLQLLLDQVDDLAKEGEPRGQNFLKWHHDVRATLKHCFPDSPEHLTTFETIRFTPTAVVAVAGLCLQIFNSRLNPYAEAFYSGIRSVKALLQSYIDEVQNLTTGESAALLDTGESDIPTNPEIVFVIHGHQLVAEFHAFLRSMGLKPLEWSQARNLTGKPNPFTWEIVDRALRSAGAVVVLLTPDDEARLRTDLWRENINSLETELLHQPRQNVLFEAGVAFGRAPERTVLIRVGSHRPMSDLAGHHILQLDNTPQSRQAVADALGVAGCPVDLSGSDWFRAGNFEC